ncbi:hypothetical protein GUITHDRAFT_108951 [Guillardia theta CCMP2712]|uniref:Cytochrome b5 heme-binding domain-containing protein n=1 Tax=Guillardia theta (strain CCMP2712) TaxID=905079 RepID=L1JAJ3_GUITC|nr:hypothetical protein GUITHDRAFT_108951 [Guillardia theta CCMP2712]EKX45312.1 hypothetical protein GUITHDRAFT_108951 [Guillardia theta CCMP2712]|eukprot:XP_005832292.1 hypothetical protein GUITHDRAFT_108951 [Guillardia theta CCMP2712]
MKPSWQITVTISLCTIYLLARWLAPKEVEDDRDKRKKKQLEPLVKGKAYTKDELFKYNGSNPLKPILIGIKGNVYDVTKGGGFYGPGGPYAAFAGRDASRMLGKAQVKPDEKDPSIDDFTPSEISSLNDWESFFSGKYELVGTLK